LMNKGFTRMNLGRVYEAIVGDAEFDSDVITTFLRGSRRDGMLLDLGCGHGRLAHHFGDKPIIFVDTDETALKLAHARAAGLDAQFISASAHKLPLRDGEIESVVMADNALSIMTPPYFALA